MTIKRDILERPFDAALIKTRKGGHGQTFSYVEAAEIVKRLNEGLDSEWSFEIVQHDVRDTEVIVLGKLTTGSIVKTAFGGSSITVNRDTGAVVGLADDLKSAATDALKKCATLLGVALHLYSDAQPQAAPPVRTTPTPGRPGNGNGNGHPGGGVPGTGSGNGNGNGGNGGTTRAAVPRTADRLTQKQLSAIWAIARRLGINSEDIRERCTADYGALPEYLSRQDGSAFIAALQNEARAPGRRGLAVSVAATLAALRAEKHVSASAVTCYLKCPRQHEHRYLRHTPPSHKPGALGFGSAIHAALARHYTGLMQHNPMPLGELEAVFTDTWRRELESPVPVLLDDGDTPEGLETKGREMLAVFHAQAEPPHRVIEVESAFSVEITDPSTGETLGARLVGAFDLVVADADGTSRIVEHKTAARRWTEDRLTYDLQLSAYSLAGAMMGYGVPRLTVQLLLKTKKPALELYHPTRTGADHRDLLEVAAGVLRAIEAGISYPVRDWHCKGCQYAHACVP